MVLYKCKLWYLRIAREYNKSGSNNTDVIDVYSVGLTWNYTKDANVRITFKNIKFFFCNFVLLTEILYFNLYLTISPCVTSEEKTTNASLIVSDSYNDIIRLTNLYKTKIL